MHVLVTGATGYIGGRLVGELLAAGHTVRCLARSPGKLETRDWVDDVETVVGDVLEPGTLPRAFAGVDAAYYLVHSMDGDGDFVGRDQRAARNFRTAAETAGIERLVYLGGMGDEGDDLSDHLHSRHEVGRELAAGAVPVTELRAAVIIGSGSASFEMLRNLTEVLPVMTTPTWVSTRCQPIAIRDVLHYLVRCLDVPETAGRVIEVGGPDVMTYRDMMHLYADVAGLRRRIIVPVPVLSPELSSRWVGLVTPLPTGLARPLVASLVNEVVVTDHVADELMPRETLTMRRAFELALGRVKDLAVPTTWAGADLARTPRRSLLEPGVEHAGDSDPSWAGGTILSDEQEVTTSASLEDLHATITGIGGDRGYYVADVLWRVRGLLDGAFGGIGLRRGRRHPDELAQGDAVDFWRVEALEPRLMRLHAEMKLPGEAWLEFRIDDDGSRRVLRQSARFFPRGLWGRAYWLSMLPFHSFIFPVMARRLVEAAERRQVAAADGVPD